MPGRAQARHVAARGLLTASRPPTLEEESVRDPCRARDDAREDRQQCRHRLGKLLPRRGLHYTGRNGTLHRQWIARLAWTQPAERAVGARRRGQCQGRQYDVAPDGRFLINTVLDKSATEPIALLTNWNPGEQVLIAKVRSSHVAKGRAIHPCTA